MAKHSHNHSHHHSHETGNLSDKTLLWSIAINLVLSLFEFIAGIISGSVALIADALHNTNDVGALLIAYIARKISRKNADDQFTFGYRRAELIGAMIQLTALVVIGLFLVSESIIRFGDPKPLMGGWIMIAAAIAFIVDIGTVFLLWGLSKGSLNVRAAFLHNLTDAGASIAVLIGGAAVYWLNWTWVDPVISLVIAGTILWPGIKLLKQTSLILMDTTPPSIDTKDVRQTICAQKGVESIHSIRIWSIDEVTTYLTAHVICSNDVKGLRSTDDISNQIKRLLNEKFQINYSTIQFESAQSVCRDK